MTRFKVISQKIAVSNKWTRIVKEEFECAKNKQGEYLIVEREPALMIIPVIKENGFVFTYLVKQHRYPIDKEVWQVPMGTLDEGKNLELHALEELRQETGLIAKSLEYQGEYYVDPGLSRQKCVVYIAKDITEGGKQELEESEEGMVAKKVTVEEFDILVKTGEINDSWAYASLHFLFQYLKK
jgi:8-oxo-dGTP pyrophosphatase MutT (NUDIX family)